MTTPTDCLFCKIRDGQIPAAITYRDEHLLAFKDIGPKAPFHELVVPLRHVERLADAEAEHAELYGRLMVAGARLAREAGYGRRRLPRRDEQRPRCRPVRVPHPPTRSGRTPSGLAAGVKTVRVRIRLKKTHGPKKRRRSDSEAHINVPEVGTMAPRSPIIVTLLCCVACTGQIGQDRGGPGCGRLGRNAQAGRAGQPSLCSAAAGRRRAARARLAADARRVPEVGSGSDRRRRRHHQVRARGRRRSVRRTSRT